MNPVPLALSFFASAALVLACGGLVVKALAAAKARQPVSGDAPASHQAKQGTPTMGGLLLIAAASLVSVGLAALSGGSARVLPVAAAFLCAGGIGVLDDMGKARKKQNKAGLSERAKLALQVLVAAGFMLFVAQGEQAGVTTALVFFGREINLGVWYYALGVLYLCGFGNAANFADGLDGLLSGTTLIVSLTLGATLGVFAPEVGLFYGALAGACAGFLWFNAHPARVFLGDTGSLAIGMGVAAAAIAAKQELLLFVVGFVYVLEIGSMLIQRYVFKWRRIRRGIEYAKANRVFRRAPLHHHFEELGWPETRVVIRFWLIGLLAAALGILLAPGLSPVRFGAISAGVGQ